MVWGLRAGQDRTGSAQAQTADTAQALLCSAQLRPSTASRVDWSVVSAHQKPSQLTRETQSFTECHNCHSMPATHPCPTSGPPSSSPALPPQRCSTTPRCLPSNAISHISCSQFNSVLLSLPSLISIGTAVALPLPEPTNYDSGVQCPGMRGLVILAIPVQSVSSHRWSVYRMRVLWF